jgi:uncharacterized integral membrane protein
MFDGDTPGMFNFPASIFAAGLWLIVLGALVAGLVTWAVVEVIRRVRLPWQRRRRTAESSCRAKRAERR